MATANDLRQMKPEELDRMLTEQREALFNLRLKLRTGHLENTASLGNARREIARLTTVLHEAQLGIVHPHKAEQAAAQAAAHPAGHAHLAHRTTHARVGTSKAKRKSVAKAASHKGGKPKASSKAHKAGPKTKSKSKKSSRK